MRQSTGPQRLTNANERRLSHRKPALQVTERADPTGQKGAELKP